MAGLTASSHVVNICRGEDGSQGAPVANPGDSPRTNRLVENHTRAGLVAYLTREAAQTICYQSDVAGMLFCYVFTPRTHVAPSNPVVGAGRGGGLWNLTLTIMCVTRGPPSRGRLFF